jgi:RNA polymerase sigma-70 factor (ECF subfamily)
MTEPTDGDLVTAFRAGEEMAATELVRRHAGAIAKYLYARGALAADVEDLLQETFFRAFRALDRWRGSASLRGWLVRIAGNLYTDQLRRGKGRQVVPLEEQDLVDHADPATEADAADLEASLRAELGRMPRLQREVFLMRAQQGLDYQEICLALGTTPGAARVHYHHAVKRLRGATQ